MLREYLNSAEEALEAKKEICTVKHDRLLLAQEEFNLLNALAASRTSCMLYVILFELYFILFFLFIKYKLSDKISNILYG